MAEFERTLVTAALPYANGPLHIGHLAGAYLPSDIYVRFLRLRGQDVVFVCGSDELGVPIMLRARDEGVSPQEIVDRYHAQIEEAFRGFGMSFNHYGRTSSPTHRETSQGFFRNLAGKDAFALKSDEQLYDPEAEIFLADRLVRGICPACDYDDAYGDQCEKCGRSLSPSDLVNPRSAITNATPVLKKTTHWYLPLGQHQAQLETWIDSHSEWKTNVLGQIKSWFADGLADRAMTRDLTWGVPVPAEVAEAVGVDVTGKVLYVWFDAPIGYVSATREWAEKQGDPELWKRYWQDEGTRLIHFIGKDNIVFHCLIFPAILKTHGEYVLPDNVPANEFLNLENDKVSTSRGWAVWVHEFLEAFPADYLRYSLTTIMPEQRDADFSWKEFQGHVNNELADTLGNLVNRTLTFAHRYFDGKVPPLEEPGAADEEALGALEAYPAGVGDLLERFRFRDALQEAMGLGRLGNKYFNDMQPWNTRKSDLRACGNTIHVSLQICASLSILLEPFLPSTCERLREMLSLDGVRPSDRSAEGDGLVGWADAGRPLIEAGQSLGEVGILVAKIEDEAIETQLAKLEAAGSGGAPYEPLSEEITYEDFAKLDFRVGKVVAAECLAKSKKLIRCDVDLGFEKRQVLAGAAEHVEPEALVGKHVVVVANLKPRQMMGTESQGMLLFAEDRDGTLLPVFTEGEPGGVVR